MDRSLRALGLTVVLLACSGARSAPPPAGATKSPEKPQPSQDESDERYAWAAATESPQPFATGAEAGSACGTSDRALQRVAERLAVREAAGRNPLDTSEITFALRSAGAPYVWPRAFTLQGETDDAVERAKVAEWLSTLGDEGEKRCAVASSVGKDGQRAFAAVLVAVLADLEPLPTRVLVGTWLDLRAVLRLPASGAEVVVLGPRGRPHSVLASLSGGSVRARFRADREGTWLVQVLATTANGPRLAAEALVAAGSEPPESFDAGKAPGEDAVSASRSPEDALLAMVNGARASEGLGRLRRDERLDRLAREHAEAMRSEKALSHGANEGSLTERLDGMSLRSAGENVAHATNLFRAHRSLWKSPSHRENLLHEAFELVGIGVVRDDDGSTWICEIFATPKHP